MKIFISWSGEQSKVIATNLSEFLKETIQSTEPWISTVDIDKGQNWLQELLKGIISAQMGIFCLTSSNLDSKWIMFESGCITSLGKKVCTLIYNIEPENISPPLSLFNSTRLEKDEVRKLFLQINSLCRISALNHKLSDESFNKILDKNWDYFINKIESDSIKILTSSSKKRSDSDKIDELINISRNIQSSLVKDLTWYDVEINGKYYRKCFDGRFRAIRKEDNGKFLINCIENEWREIIEIGHPVSSDMVLKVQIMLNQNGYDVKNDNILDADTKAALTMYQKENGLPVGALDFETLKSLGVK